jgi:hypothetical protein
MKKSGTDRSAAGEAAAANPDPLANASQIASRHSQNFIWWDIGPLGEIGSSDKTYAPM